MIEGLKLNEEELVQTEIPTPLSSTALERILKWTSKWQNTPQPSFEDIRNKTDETIDEWNQNFLKMMSLEELFDLVS